MTLVSRARHWLPLLPLLGMLGITYWLNQKMQPEPLKPDNKKQHFPDAIIENFSATQMSLQGLPRYILVAKKMLHFSDNDSTELEAPHFTTLSPQHPTINIYAQHGIVSSKGNEIFLDKDVRVVRAPQNEQSELELFTEYLHILPDKDLAETDRTVAIVDTKTTTHAIGLEMDNKTRTLKLLAQVRSEYVPTKK